ncbi:MAG: hypothetical protein EPN25_10015 [Nitrospirae bacterium]|nr:MAG: hypothetical protein EPN25_10015 [Nitrospirota bacterium]
MRKLLIIALSGLLCASCSTSGTKIYNLTLPEEKAGVVSQQQGTVNISVTAPRYLSQPYMALRTSPYQLEISRYSKWDAPPIEIVREAFKASVAAGGTFREIRTSAIAPEGAYSLEVSLKRFERSETAEASFAELAFEVLFRSPEGRELYSRTITKMLRLDEKSFHSLAKGMSSALAEGISEIKAGLPGR